ncbi:peptidylprolyl isomerase [Chloroflexota bacterium]
MSQSRRKRADRITTEQAPNSELASGDHKGKWTKIIISSAVILLILVIAGISFYPTYIAPYRRTIIAVDDTTIPMSYFLKRLQLDSGTDPLNMLDQITKEQIIKLGAPQYGIEVSPEDVDEALRTLFQGGSETVSESEFREWYRQRLNATGLSDSEYRELLTIGLLESDLQQYLAERVPTVAEQRHIYIIFTETYEKAEEARARWETGEDFTDVARELSIDEETSEIGGEIGWFPRGGTLNIQLEYSAFNLSTGNVSQPAPFFSEESSQAGGAEPEIVGYYIVWVTEEAARQLDEDNLQAIKDNVLEDWYLIERSNHTIRISGLNNGFDSETYAWIHWQLVKSQTDSE